MHPLHITHLGPRSGRQAGLWIVPRRPITDARTQRLKEAVPLLGSIGPMEIAIVLVIALLVVGPKRLPEAGRSLGRGMREFKDSLTGTRDDESQERSSISA
jgi:sec-independent protein translocase protein TatA